MAKFCHTSNRLLVGPWHSHALWWLYFNSSVVSWPVVGGWLMVSQQYRFLGFGSFPPKEILFLKVNSDGMDDRQLTPRGYPNFNSYIANLNLLVLWMDGQRDGQRNRQTDREINLGGATSSLTLAVRGLEELFSAVLERSLQPTLHWCSVRIWLVMHVNITLNNFLQIFLLNQNFLLAHRNRY